MQLARVAESVGYKSAPDETMAAVLCQACPASALRFALAMHERLCERGEDDHAELWLGVVRQLTDSRGGAGASPAR